MYIIESYSLAVFFCFITMLCWGSWANTQKLAASTWRFELFYWDYVIGIVLLSLVFGFTLGSNGSEEGPLWQICNKPKWVTTLKHFWVVLFSIWPIF